MESLVCKMHDRASANLNVETAPLKLSEGEAADKAVFRYFLYTLLYIRPHPDHITPAAHVRVG